jgi:hypothetical protein
MHIARLPLHNRPAHKLATMPEMKLGGKKEPAKKLIVPPKAAARTPTYGPRIMPIIGTVIAAAVML